MGLFSSSKKIYTKDFGKSLSQSGLSPKEKAYAKKVFKNELSGGLSKFEAKRKCSQLTRKSGDLLRSDDVARIKEKLLKRFK